MKDLMTSEMLAKRWGMHRGSLARWRSQKKGPPFLKLGSGKNASVYYRMIDVIKWEKNHLIKGESENDQIYFNSFFVCSL